MLQLEVSQKPLCLGTSRSGGAQVEGSIEELEGELEGAREHGQRLVRPCVLRLSVLSERLLLKICHALRYGCPAQLLLVLSFNCDDNSPGHVHTG